MEYTRIMRDIWPAAALGLVLGAAVFGCAAGGAAGKADAADSFVPNRSAPVSDRRPDLSGSSTDRDPAGRAETAPRPDGGRDAPKDAPAAADAIPGSEIWLIGTAVSAQFDFAASEVKRALEKQGLSVVFKTWADASAPGSAPRIYLGLASTEARMLLATHGGKALPATMGEQTFAVRAIAGAKSYWALGGDAAGIIYGGLALADAIEWHGLAGVKDADGTPYIRRRGVKFNIPLDARTPSYSDNADAATHNVAAVWDIEFWKRFLDGMARSRLNVLSLWSLHPFPSMVKVPEYPNVALADVKTTSARWHTRYALEGFDMVNDDVLTNLVHVKTISIDDKIKFWREVMKYAKDRGIETYVFTWNIFVWGAQGKYGITTDQTNTTTIDYVRKSVRELILTYPDLAGLGITAGEQMQKRTDEFSKEQWLWKTYGEGVRDALARTPGRSVRMVHRQHQGSVSSILADWKAYPGPFDLSFKYAQAHVYSGTKPPFIASFLTRLPAGTKTWLTLRNDDIYYHRFGDPEYVREYIRNIPRAQVEGFMFGPDGYIIGRDFLSIGPDAVAGRLEIERQWMAYASWGRLAYDPATPAESFQSLVTTKFPTARPDFAAGWRQASRIIPLVSRYHWEDLDFQWYPEGSTSHPTEAKGYHDVQDFVNGNKMPGTMLLSVKDYADMIRQGMTVTRDGPVQVADELKMLATAALAAGQGSEVVTDKELRSTMADLAALGHLGNFYAEKILGAADLALGRKPAALGHLQQAVAHARSYAAVNKPRYKGQFLTRIGQFDWDLFVKNAEADLSAAGGN